MNINLDIKGRLKQAKSTVSRAKGFKEFQLGTISFVLGTGLLSTVISIYMRYVRNIPILQIGIIGTISSALSAVLQFSSGGLSERFGKKPILVFCFTFLGLLIPFYALASTATDFLILLSIHSVTITLIDPTSCAFLGDIAPEDTRARVFSLFGFITNIFYVVSLFMTLILKVIDVSLLFLISGCFVIVATVLMLRVKEERIVPKVKRRADDPETKSRGLGSLGRARARVSRRISQGAARLKSILRDKCMLGITLNFVFFSLAVGIYPYYFPLFLVSLGAAKEWAGPLVSISWFTFAVAQPYGGSISDRLRKRKPIILYGLFFATITNMAMSFSTSLLLVLIFWGLLGIGDGISRPVRLALVVDKVKEKRGLAFGTIWAISTLLGIAMPLVYGYLAYLGTSSGLGFSLAYSLATIFLLMSTVSIWAFVKEEGKCNETKSDSQIPS